MRKAQKTQTEDFVKLLEEVHSEIKKALLGGDITAAQELLGQCQQGAIELGGLIEKTEGEGFVTVAYLEKYCEIVYAMYEEISAEAVVNAEKVYKHLRKALLTVENSVRNEIPVRKEIAFFPYKASMWDSLESVYLAAKEDPECDAYCVPIPYYDKNSDGSFGQIHYEGREYPKNIEIIDWKTYNFEERRPDAIYIHNPYDECNYVTSVHPRFYSSNLKKYTEELVYIPYFILGEPDPNNEKDVENIRHFCLQPGVLNADKVILQSEAMCQVYMNEYVKAARAEGVKIHKESLRKKYLGLGSPKLEKVKNTKKEDVEIPPSWLSLIQKPDGSYKKIIFYNTSVTALLQHEEKMLEKMRWVFGVLKENQEEVTLLWRPHPLIKATIASMRPRLWQAYEQLTNEYKAEGWGIYDDTADLDRAIALSDAYYGDRSSVVQLYQNVKKPIMLQRLDVPEYIPEKFIFGKHILVEKNNLYMAMTMLNVIVKADLQTGTLERCSGFGEIYLDQWNHTYLYTDVVSDNDILFFAPTRANAVALLNKKNNTIKTKILDIPNEFSRGVPNYALAISDSRNVFLIGVCQTNAIIKLNIQTEKIEYYGYLINQNEEIKNKAIFGQNVVIVKEKLYIPLLNKGNLYELDLKTKKERILLVDTKKRDFSTINFYKEVFYITTKTGDLLKWTNGKTEEIALPNRKAFYCSCCVNELLWLFPENAEESILKIDLSTEKISKIHFPYMVYHAVLDKSNEKLILNIRGGVGKLDIFTNHIETITYNIPQDRTLEDLINRWDDMTNIRKEKIEGRPECDTLQKYIKENIEEKYVNKC